MQNEKMQTPIVTSRTCGQDCTTPPNIFEDVCHGQDGFALPTQEKVTPPKTTLDNVAEAAATRKALQRIRLNVSTETPKTRSCAEDHQEQKRARLQTPLTGHGAATAAAAITDDANQISTNLHSSTAAITSPVNSPQKRFKQVYELCNHISKTLYGNIFTCQAKESGKIFACKVMLNSRVRNNLTRCGQRAYDNPATEVKLLRILSERHHPNLLSLVDQFVDTTHTYFVLPLARGGDLLSSVEARPRGLDPREVLKIFRQLVRGLQHLQTLGWQHGDLSLENILITSDSDSGINNVKLCDFGLATPLGTAGRPVGKVLYMAPEVLRASDKKDARFKVTTAQDIFSLGVAMFMTLFGFPPFECACATDRNYNDLQRTVDEYRAKLVKWRVSPTKAQSNLLPLLMKMMHKSAEERPTLKVILDYLESVKCC